jgi:hypothetical protein
MKLLGLLLLASGWAIALAAVILLKTLPQRSVFAIAGIAVEALGLMLVVRAHQAATGLSE